MAPNAADIPADSSTLQTMDDLPMYRNHIAATLLLALSLSACSQHRLDATSAERLENSSKQMMEGLSKPQRERLQTILTEIQILAITASWEEAQPEQAAQKVIRQLLHDKTAQDILAWEKTRTDP